MGETSKRNCNEIVTHCNEKVNTNFAYNPGIPSDFGCNFIQKRKFWVDFVRRRGYEIVKEHNKRLLPWQKPLGWDYSSMDR